MDGQFSLTEHLIICNSRWLPNIMIRIERKKESTQTLN